ncbi:MAG: hypothetical protein AAF401_02025 [Pseudomonadota bacterium]
MTEEPRTPVLTLDGVVKRVGKRVAIRGLSHDFYAGDLVYILGGGSQPKQLLTRIIAGQLLPDQGHVLRNGPPGPMPGGGMGFQMVMSALRGLEMRAAAFGVDYRDYVDRISALMRNPEVLRKPFKSIQGVDRNMLLFGSAYLLPATHYVSDNAPMSSEPMAKRRVGPIYEAARERAAIIVIPKRDPSPTAMGDAKVLYFNNGVLSEVPPEKPEKKRPK